MSSPSSTSNAATYLEELSMEEMLMQFTQAQQQQMQNQQASMRNLETQIGQLANALNNRPPGRLPSDTQVPKIEEKKECKAIELRS